MIQPLKSDMMLFRFTLCLLFGFCTTTHALNLDNLHEIPLPLPANMENRTLGTSVAISGSTAAVAAYSSDKAVAGAVFLYAADENWRLATKLQSKHLADGFAKHIVLVDKLLIVSAEQDNTQGENSGAVYIFQRHSTTNPHNWRQIAKLTAPDAQAGDRFGQGITLVDGVLYIGAPSHGQGKVYLFTLDSNTSSWRLSDSIEPEDSQAQHFGAAIAQDGSNLIIGAPYTDADNSLVTDAKKRTAQQLSLDVQPRFAITKGNTFDPGIQCGAIFVYQKQAGQWQYIERIGASNRESADHLGEQIAIEGDIIAASVRQKDVFDHLRAGSVYVYKHVTGEWQEDTALVASKPNVGANFGNSFVLQNKQILVGANKVHANGFNSGQVYLFDQGKDNTWDLIHQQANTTLKAHDQFGLSVALSSERILVAAKHTLYAFQNTPIHYHPAVFYPHSSSLQLNEVALAGAGVLSATLHLSQQSGEFMLTLTDYQLRTNIKNTDIEYALKSGRLTIPRLALQTQMGELSYYSAVLQQIQNPAKIQFKVLALNPL